MGAYPRETEDTLISNIMDAAQTALSEGLQIAQSSFSQALSQIASRGLSGDSVLVESMRQQFAAIAAMSAAKAQQEITTSNMFDRVLMARATATQPQLGQVDASTTTNAKTT